jgi:hypothetical protein
MTVQVGAGDIYSHPVLNLSKMNMIEVSFNSPPHYDAFLIFKLEEAGGGYSS